MNKITRNYTVIEEIGRGGMAVVYKGWQRFLDRPIVIKELLPLSNGGDEFIKRFEREAKVVANLQHENIVIIHDGWKEREKIYIIMEFIDGIDLKKLLVKKRQIPVLLSIYIMWSLTKALEYAHEKKIIHRDIKPGNVLISKRGDVRLVDFGIARDLNSLGLTYTGEMLGTPAYMSPEQIKGEKVDVFTDVFSLGVITYEMIVGKHPFCNEDNDEVKAGTILEKKQENIKKIKPEVPNDIAKILDICLMKDFGKRHENMEIIRRGLDKYVKKYSQKSLAQDLENFISDSLPLKKQEKTQKTQHIKRIERTEVAEISEDRKKEDQINELALRVYLVTFLFGCVSLVAGKYIYLYFK